MSAVWSVVFYTCSWQMAIPCCTILALLPLLVCMSMCRYKWTCSSHPSLQASAWWTKRARRLATLSLCSNVDTIVLDDLNRYDRKQLPHLSLHKRLGNVVQLAYSLVGQRRFSLRSNVDSIYIVLVSLNRYDREQFNNTELLASLDSVAQLTSAMAMFLLRSNVDSILARETRAPLCALRHLMHLLNKPCLLHTVLSFRPIRCILTQNNTFWKIFFIYSNITIQSLSQRSICCRSRKCIQGHIPIHAIFAIFFCFFVPVLSRSYFTSRTPDKEQRIKQLFYFLLV